MMNEKDFREVIISQRSKSKVEEWAGAALDYLYLVKENPEIAQFAPSRLYNALMKYGTEPIDDDNKIRGYEDLIKYNYFDDKIYGTQESLHDIMKFFKASARRTETGRRILILVGPVSSGKSTIAYILKRCLENDDTPAYEISGCPIHEDPIHLIPLGDRPFWEEQLGIKIEGSLCPICQMKIDEDYRGEWERVPVNRFAFNEQRRVGIGTFQPSDPKSQDVSELIGRVDYSKMTMYSETDPRAFKFNGELQVANRGIIDFIELLKTDTKLLYVLITAAQEQLIKSPGFPQMYIDVILLAHTNESEYSSFKADKKSEAIHDRMYPIMVPWNLRVDNEIQIYKKLIKESEFKNIHISPLALEVAAKFAVLTRLKKSTKVSSLIEKMRLYNNEAPEGFKREEIDIKELRQEGRENAEGMTGISPRFIMNALNIALASKEDKTCINALDVIRSLNHNFEHHIGYTPEEKANYQALLLADKDSVLAEFKTLAKKEVQLAFISAYDDQVQNLFANYLKNALAYCKKEKVKDDVLGEFSDPDEKLMRSIEESIGVPINSVKEFRQAIFVQKSSCLERGEKFDYTTYTPLKEAIEHKLMNDLKNVVSLTLCDPAKSQDKKIVKKRQEVLDTLKERGYCEYCAYALLQYVEALLRKES